MPPPGPGLKTVNDAVVAEARSAVRIEAVSCVLLTKTVVRSAAFQRTVELLTKPEPRMVIVKPGLPAVVLDGSIEAGVGSGFGI